METIMRNLSNFRAAVAVAALAISAAGIGIAGAANAEEPARASSSAVSAESVPTVDHQRGVVLEGTGSSGGLDVMVTVYDNSLYGSSVQVVLGDPDDDRIGYAEQGTPYVVDGQLNAGVEIEGRVVTLSGAVVETGRPEKLREPLQDGGEQIITRGTHTQLVTDVHLSVGDTVVPVTFAPAFAYDLEVRKVDLYGN